MRLFNLVVAAALVIAAGYVYKSKFAATVEAERVAKLRTEIVRERDMIAMLRAESAKIEAPARIQALAQRHLALKALDLNQIATIDAIPFPPTEMIASPREEPVTATAKPATAKPATAELATGSISTPSPVRKPAAASAAASAASSPAKPKHAAPVAAVKPRPPASVPKSDAAFAPPRPPADMGIGDARATADPR